MQAVVVNQPDRGVLRVVTDRAAPVARPGEVLIRVQLAGICATDLEIARGYMRFAGVPGHEFVGVVVEGSNALRGRRVVGEINCVCGGCDLCRAGLSTHCRRRTVLGILGRDGAFAELLTLPERNCHVVPDEISDTQAVFVEPLAAALHVLKDAAIDRHARVAVLGTGRLGLLIAQVIANARPRLTVIGRNPRTLEVCERLGIHALRVEEASPTEDYDVVVETTGSPAGMRLALQLVRPRGTIVLKSTYAEPEPIDLAPIVINEIRVVGSRCGVFADALAALRARHVDVERMVTAVYPLRDAVDAFAAAASPESIKVLLRPDAV
ncbi:MAG: alcohol dehydrogenase catalytic domain-containing protein [Phycisphaerae bacterium]